MGGGVPRRLRRVPRDSRRCAGRRRGRHRASLAGHLPLPRRHGPPLTEERRHPAQRLRPRRCQGGEGRGGRRPRALADAALPPADALRRRGPLHPRRHRPRGTPRPHRVPAPRRRRQLAGPRGRLRRAAGRGGEGGRAPVAAARGAAELPLRGLLEPLQHLGRAPHRGHGDADRGQGQRLHRPCRLGGLHGRDHHLGGGDGRAHRGGGGVSLQARVVLEAGACGGGPAPGGAGAWGVDGDGVTRSGAARQRRGWGTTTVDGFAMVWRPPPNRRQRPTGVAAGLDFCSA
mmetsp:Transcript_16630/g.38273  ORF Transcript_16630/g.38273 Transcript_16630/m.38273 type:complete len:288 (+) Transcript_16630:1-864(+)